MKEMEHTFGPGETIKGIIRKFNRYNKNSKVPTDIMEKLSKRFAELNPKNTVPRVGDTYKIPIYYNEGEAPITPEATMDVVKPEEEIVELTKEILSSIIIEEEEEPEMPKKKDDNQAMLDRQRRRELARGETPKEHVLIKEQSKKESANDTKKSKFKEKPEGRKRRVPVNPKKKKLQLEEEKVVDLEKEKEKEEIAELVKGKSVPSSRQRHHRNLRKRRRG